MAAGLVVPVSGPYTGTYNSLPLGTQNDDGFRLSCTIQGQEINASDAYGMTLVEGIYRGQNWRVAFTGLEANKTGLLAILQAFGQVGAAGTLTPKLTGIGNRMTTYAQALVLTAILADPPTMPQTLTAVNAVFAPNTNTQMLMTSKMREMPLELVLLPYASVVGSVTSYVPFTAA
ncbi:MAG: hypothetical protein K2X38_25505 [Gemmataceae bacterium]|nr:hypothetical protein [Gemmataceae bacterium]